MGALRDDPRYPPVMSTKEPVQPAGRGDEGDGVRIRQLEKELKRSSERCQQTVRELQAAKSDIGIKDQYITSLEADLDAKSARIDSFPQVRARLWLARLRSHRQR